MRILAVLILGCTLNVLSFAAPAAEAGKGKSEGSPGFRLGDRLPQSERAGGTQGFKEIKWDALMPPDWDPMQALKGLDFGKLDDADPRATEALERLRREWSKAPVNRAMHGVRIRIPGFVVPLEGERDKLREFLLVPYFGACIHVPPPPANQVIHVISAKPLSVQSMDAVWVNGTVETFHAPTPMGDAGYRMKAEAVSAFKPPADAR